ncbi:hypothetical protein Tco_1333382 [Tanacetum coccineum]
MEKTRCKPKELLPYGMLLTRLFKHVVSVSPELTFDHFVSHDRLPSSTIQNHPSSSNPLDHMVDVSDDESFHSNSSFPSQQVSSSSTVDPLFRQNPSYESHDLHTFLSETITFQTQQRDAHREGLSQLDMLSRT